MCLNKRYKNEISSMKFLYSSLATIELQKQLSKIRPFPCSWAFNFFSLRELDSYKILANWEKYFIVNCCWKWAKVKVHLYFFSFYLCDWKCFKGKKQFWLFCTFLVRMLNNIHSHLSWQVVIWSCSLGNSHSWWTTVQGCERRDWTSWMAAGWC